MRIAPTINLHDTLALDVLEGADTSSRWDYGVLPLVPKGSPTMFSVRHMVFGDNLLPDVRLSSTPGGGVYQLSSSRSSGSRLRYSF